MLTYICTLSAATDSEKSTPVAIWIECRQLSKKHGQAKNLISLYICMYICIHFFGCVLMIPFLHIFRFIGVKAGASIDNGY